MAFDAREFRSALGTFATGVTVVTARAASGEPVGLTANSFSSVSLQPPLVLWSLARSSHCLPAFSQTEHWAVHVLASEQEALSNRFATRGADKFAGIDVEAGIGNVPLLRDCAARFQCRTAFQYDGGDHVIFVGSVLGFDRRDVAPLLFQGGRYALALEKATQDLQQAPALTGIFSEDYLGYLLGRGHFQVYKRFKEHIRAAGISDDEHLVLAALTVRAGMSAAELDRSLGHIVTADLAGAIRSLQARGYIDGGPPDYRLAPAGRDCALQIIAAAKAHEERVTEHFGSRDLLVLKSLLRKLVALTEPQAAAP